MVGNCKKKKEIVKDPAMLGTILVVPPTEKNYLHFNNIRQQNYI